MSGKKARFEKAFIDGKRAQLTKLREDLLSTTQGKEGEETDINANSNDDAREYEDDAQRLTMLELDGNLVARNKQRLARVERALRKIEEGTYGLSDASGAPIPQFPEKGSKQCPTRSIRVPNKTPVTSDRSVVRLSRNRYTGSCIAISNRPDARLKLGLLVRHIYRLRGRNFH